MTITVSLVEMINVPEFIKEDTTKARDCSFMLKIKLPSNIITTRQRMCLHMSAILFTGKKACMGGGGGGGTCVAKGACTVKVTCEGWSMCVWGMHGKGGVHGQGGMCGK